eukprot:gb/GECH01000353.1/.p1 GENE.gb/GECH01000353.1/~~gb/GECH01000353.1/.p1  ORF type:complete len:269 (+),score=63.68 gb/GECH01000353.1/:1-807(+)
MSLPLPTGTVAAFTVPVVFVLSLYLFPGAVSASRNTLTVIRRRTAAVVLASSASLIGAARYTSWRSVGVTAPWRVSLWGGVYGGGITAVLFLGVLLHDGVGKVAWDTPEERWHSLRALVIGPITEELSFRAAVLAFLRHGDGYTVGSSILLSSLVFGLGHMHHIFEHIVHGKINLIQAIQMILFQFAYTSLFGSFAATLHMYTGTVIAPIVSHILCNYLGFPDFSAIMQDHRRHVRIGLFVGAIAFGIGVYALVAGGCPSFGSPLVLE